MTEWWINIWTHGGTQHSYAGDLFQSEADAVEDVAQGVTPQGYSCDCTIHVLRQGYGRETAQVLDLSSEVAEVHREQAAEARDEQRLASAYRERVL